MISKAESGRPISPETIDDLAEALSTAEDKVYPEDLILDPIALARDYVIGFCKDNEHAGDRFKSRCHPEVTLYYSRVNEDLDSSRHHIGSGHHIGIEAVVEACDKTWSALQFVQSQKEVTSELEFFYFGNEVVVWGLVSMRSLRGQSDSEPRLVPFTIRIRFSGGQIVEVEDRTDYYSRAGQ